MLKELYLEYKDGRKETKIIYLEPNQQVTIYPQRDNIKNSSCRPFTYKVDKHPYLPVAIARFYDKTVILPSGIECHEKTTLQDIIEIDNTPVKVEESTLQPIQPKLRVWGFVSSSGGGTYEVKETKNGSLKCDCPGVWRSKDRKCKHIKEVEKELGIVK